MRRITASVLLAAVFWGPVLAGPAAASSSSPADAGGETSTSTTSTTSALPSVRLPLPGATVPSGTVRVLPALAGGSAVPTEGGLARALTPLLARPLGLGRSVSAEVVDVATGQVLFGKDAVRPVAPASAAKLLTAAAALTRLGPDTTLPTRTVLVPGAAASGTPTASSAGSSEAAQVGQVGQVVLVGGGDVMLAPGPGDPRATMGHAGLGDLADATAVALRARGVTGVVLRLDDALFSGAAVNPAWLPGDVRGGFVAPVMPIAVTVGTAVPGRAPEPGRPAPRVADPALAAAKQFAALLSARGVAVTGPVVRAAAPAGAAVLAEVRSASVADIVEHDLTDSDNTTAEALARLVAIAARRPATFADGGRAVLDQVAALGVPVTGAELRGGSGLGRGTLAPASTIARLVALAAGGRTDLRPLLTGLPVAGASGTLSDRYDQQALAAGLGVVRAKTGTLTGVGSLAGTVVDADGRLLAFAVLADAVPSIGRGRAALDAIASALAGCGCR